PTACGRRAEGGAGRFPECLGVRDGRHHRGRPHYPSLMTTLSPFDSMSPVNQAAYRAKAAAATLAPLPRAAKDDALLAIADALEVRASEIVEANAQDVAKAREAGTSEGMIDRLTLTPE